MSTSHSLQSNPITPNNDEEREVEQLDSPDKAPDTKEPLVQVYIYPQRKKKSSIERPSLEEAFELKEVNIERIESWQLIISKVFCPGGFSPTNNTIIVSFLFRLQLREDENCDRLEQNTKETESGGEDIQPDQENNETESLRRRWS